MFKDAASLIRHGMSVSDDMNTLILSLMILGTFQMDHINHLLFECSESDSILSLARRTLLQFIRIQPVSRGMHTWTDF